MNLLRVSWRNLWHNPFASAVSVLLLTLGVAMVSLVLHLSKQIEGQFTNNINGIDLVIGAKGSAKQLILSSIYHLDAPTGNISKKEADRFMKHPLVKEAIPLAYGDSYRGYKILGTTNNYISFFKAELAQGRLFETDMEVVLGAHAANMLGLGLGDTFFGSHGMEEKDEEHTHKEHAYKVVGILKPSGLALDQLIICNIPTVWLIHSNETHGGEEHNDDKEYTAVLLSCKNAMGMMQLTPMINRNTNMLAASPSVEISSLIYQMGLGVETLRVLAMLIILISGISVFFSLLNALKERRYELAVMRSLGASPLQLMAMVVYEALLIALISFIVGMALSRGLFWYLSVYLSQNYHYSFSTFSFISEEYQLALVIGGIALLASVIPAFIAFRTNISKTLAED
ncbi:FtsX-like permease family protein [bacterium]|nr:FtsX-like permease family protein [bacterium]